MTKKVLNFPVYLVLFSVSVLWLLPNSAMAEGDGGWTTTTSPGYIFQIEEDLFNNQKHLVMTVIKPDRGDVEFYWGPASGSVGSTYLLKPLNVDSDMMATWRFNSDIQATVTVESCSTNCLWQAGEVVTLNKFFGDNQDSQTAQRYGGCTCGGTMAGTRWCDNGDGTVTDLMTCLVWLKKADWGNAYPWGGPYWSDDNAHTRAASLRAGYIGADLSDGSKHGDWRLPTANELYWLANGTDAVRSNSMQAFTGVVAYYYWSSNTCPEFGPSQAARVNLSDGIGGCADMQDSFGIWPVRAWKTQP